MFVLLFWILQASIIQSSVLAIATTPTQARSSDFLIATAPEFVPIPQLTPTRVFLTSSFWAALSSTFRGGVNRRESTSSSPVFQVFSSTEFTATIKGR